MFWAAARALANPSPFLRYGIDIGVACLAGYLLFLGVLDRSPPFVDPRPVVRHANVHVGDGQAITWTVTEQRYCPEIVSHRWLVSEADPGWWLPLNDVFLIRDPDAPRPALVRIGGVEFQIPADFPMLPDGAPTKAWFRIDIVSACNWLQLLMPEAWRIHYLTPATQFWVTREK